MHGRVLVLATGNRHKIAEIVRIFPESSVGVVPVFDLIPGFDVVEDGVTFAENAFKKAAHAYELTGRPALADDSGLEVDALDGAPGVYSNRFAGREGDDAANNAKLLHLLRDVPDEKRTARFRTVMAFVTEHGVEYASGTCEGSILRSPEGSNGFGYDPLFFYPEMQRSFASLTQDEKNSVSHRGRALAAIAPVLRTYFTGTAR
ncbi:RdgB/HAM1 family non-canonical purine NTP pyrophosphatase [bacterium]|nr:RdgB/HAM1 family non-canonical purine NTP pyrophosphatase [bacterium]